MKSDPRVIPGTAEASGQPLSTLPIHRRQPLPWALWVAVVFSPLLGWLSALCILAAAAHRLFKTGVHSSFTQLNRGPGRWVTIMALCWWLTLLAGDLLATPTVAWWQDFRFLLVILPACLLMPRFQQAAITHEQVGRWATWSVWVTVAVIGLEYLVTVQWAGMVHHRPRALSGNALFVSTLMVPMMLLCWLGAPLQRGGGWVLPMTTYVAGIACLAALLGARTSTLIAAVMMPLPILWLRRSVGWVPRAGWAALTLLIMVALLAFIAPRMSPWYEERWSALVGVMTGANPAQLTDYGIATRALHWPAAWQAFADKPWLGHGFQNENATLRQHLPAGTPVLPTAHQQFLSFLLWSGVPGLITGCLLIALPIVMAFIRRRSSLGMYAAVAVSLPVLLNGLSDTVFDDLRIVSQYLMLVVLLDAVTEPPVAQADHRPRPRT